MRTSLKTLANNNSHSIKYNYKQLRSDTRIDFEENMSILTKNNKNYQEKVNDDSNKNEEEENGDEFSKFVSIKIENNQGGRQQQQKQQHEQEQSATKLRSILRKRNENPDDDDEKDSDYIGDQNEQESHGSNKSIEEESKNNEQRHRCRNYSRQTQRNRFFRTSPSPSPSTPIAIPLDKTKKETRAITSATTITLHDIDHSPSRTTCVKFTKDQPNIIHRSSSTPQLGTIDIQPRSSITYINMRQDRSTAVPITTTGSSNSITNEYHPVYVSPLKYRPLVGLSPNHNRILLEKRVSLLGKPLVLHPIHRRSASYRRTQLRVYNFLERPHGYTAVIYHTFVFLTVFVCLFLSVVVTMPEYESIATTVLLQTEILVVIWLSIELTLRVWSAGCRSRYQTLMGRLRFMRNPFCALDFVVIMATVVTLCLNTRSGNGVFAASALRGIRFFQILRMLRMDRRGGTWKLLGSVVYAHRQELITTIYIGFLVLIFSSFIMFLVEKDTIITETKDTLINNATNLLATGSITNLIDTDRHKFETFADALWWGIITLCTVGYGDKVPSSYMGKLIAAICSFIGISFFALPAGILGSGFALKVQQQQRQKHYKRRKIPAVLLIQNLWRVYAADEKSLSKATWKVHVRPSRKETNDSSTSQTNPHVVSFRMRNNQSFLNRVSFRRRTPTRETALIPLNNPHTTNSPNMKLAPNSAVAAMRSCIDTLSETVNITPPISMNVPTEGSSSDNDDDHSYYANDVQSLTSNHRHAIRFIRKVKYFVARRKFREALRPYDVTDVIEQYSTGNVDMLARMKYLQARLDKVLGTSKSLDSYESGPSLASRICKIEKQIDNLDLKVDRLCELTNNVLERGARYDATNSVPTSTGSLNINRCRTVNRFHAYRRQRRRIHPRTVTSASSTSTPPPPATAVASSRHNSYQSKLTRPSLSSSLAARTRSRESLVSLYCLFQDNINSSRTSHV